MIIDRLRVEEGFLAGLDLSLAPGLNVLVGPRGSGKTSLIELIRFCLGATTITEAAGTRARQHALSVLGSGQVTVTLRDSDKTWTVTRTASDERPRASQPIPQFTILAQNEIEAIGLEARGRLRLVDAFRINGKSGSGGESARSALRSATVEIRDLAAEIAQIDSQLSALAEVPKELAAVQAEESRVLKSSAATEADQSQLRQLQEQTAALSVRASVVGRARDRLAAWQQELERVARSAPKIEEWPDSAGADDLLRDFRSRLIELTAIAQRLPRQASKEIDGLSTVLDRINTERINADESARVIRSRLEKLQEGAGAITRRVAGLREQAGQRAALLALRKERAARHDEIRRERERILLDLERLANERFVDRQRVVDWLNRTLGPRIHVEVERAQIDTDYVAAVTTALRGSGLHYNTLAPALAETMSPRELVEAAEIADAQRIAAAAQIPLDRAARVIDQLLATGTEDVISARLEDGVRLELLDGSAYKPTEELSTGQRCTVVLPILLSHHGRTLVVDQPEDHLDNAFIAETVIRALLARETGDQLIVSTHNANIPVLGDADEVIVLGSDGKRGFKRHAGPLEDPASINAITTLMEGGIEAFRRRAQYYSGLAEE